MLVPVLDTNRKPLMPIKPSLARLLLTQKKASAYWNKLGIFCIILHKEVEVISIEPIVIGIDPGSSFEGWSVVGTKNTILNATSEAPNHVKHVLEIRKNMRRCRRYRKCWRRPVRSANRCKNRDPLPPSTHARWNAKLRILEQLLKILPISDVVIEDIQAVTKKGQKKWNESFSPVQQGKNWFYDQIRNIGLTLHLKQGFETKELRDKYGLGKSSAKNKKTFFAHAVDAWVMAASMTKIVYPDYLTIFYWTPIRLHRRQLHTLRPSHGGIRTLYGGTRSMGLSRGTLVRHIKYGLTYVGGTSNNRISLHDIRTGNRLTQNVKTSDCKVFTKISWRTTVYK